MTFRDFLVTPIWIILILVMAWLMARRVTDRNTYIYFYPALILKILGALGVGLIYQFYYRGGDTFTYFRDGSYYLWKAFLDSPVKGLDLLFIKAGTVTTSTYDYSSHIVFFGDPASYFIIRIAGVLDLFTFHTYSATAVLFAVFSFSGSWAFYTTFCRLYPRLHLPLAVAVFFIPSVFFWGSGLLKDSITLGALFWMTSGFIYVFIERRSPVLNLIVIFVSFYILYVVKIYILLCFIPALLVWLYHHYISAVKNPVAKIMILPFMLIVVGITGYYAVKNISSENSRYNLHTLTNTAEATARWISYVSETEGGSTYSLGDYDYSVRGLVAKSHKAIWVTLFRPYFWESKNPVMILAAIESFIFLVFTLYALFRSGLIRFFRILFTQPAVLFCMIFTLTFSFAVGITTYNFGSLVRYKIPMMPFYLIGLCLILYYSNSPRKAREPETVE